MIVERRSSSAMAAGCFGSSQYPMPIIKTNCLPHQALEQSRPHWVARTYRSRRGSRGASNRIRCAVLCLTLGDAALALLLPNSPAPNLDSAAEAGIAVDSTLATATAAANGNIKRSKLAIGEASRFQ